MFLVYLKSGGGGVTRTHTKTLTLNKYMICLVCCQETSNPKFCSSSCAATYNNSGRRRHGKGPNNCLICGSLTKSSARLYCSRECKCISSRTSIEHKRSLNAANQGRYRSKKYRVTAPDADKDKIKQIYLNCPEGYEVDHIIPLSKGGKHHEDNLQYLTILENRKKNNRIVVGPV